MGQDYVILGPSFTNAGTMSQLVTGMCMKLPKLSTFHGRDPPEKDDITFDHWLYEGVVKPGFVSQAGVETRHHTVTEREGS